MKDENQNQTIPSGFRREAEEIVAKSHIVSEVILSDANTLAIHWLFCMNLRLKRLSWNYNRKSCKKQKI